MADTTVKGMITGVKDFVKSAFTRPNDGKEMLTAVGIGAAGLESIYSLWEQFQAGEMNPISFVFSLLSTGVSTVFNAIIYGGIGYGIGWALDKYSGVNVADEARKGLGLVEEVAGEALDEASARLDSIKTDLAAVYLDASKDATEIASEVKNAFDLDGSGDVSTEEAAKVIGKLANHGVSIVYDRTKDFAAQLPVIAQQLKDKATELAK